MKTKRGRYSEAGFSLVELLVTVIIMAEILVGVTILFDSSNRLARSQTHLAGLQQSLRVGQSKIVRYARMAGIGGLPITRLNFDAGTEPDGTNTDYSLLGAFPRSGYAVSVINNVPADQNIVTAVDSGSTEAADGEVLEGSDVLILRGVFSTPLYYFDPPLDISGWDDADGDLTNSPTVNQLVTVPERVRIVGDVWEDYPQVLTPLRQLLEDALSAGEPVALILRDTLSPNAYGVMEFDHDNTTGAMLTPADCPDTPATAVGSPQCIQFYVRLDPSDTPGDGYGDVSTGTILEPGDDLTITLDAGPPVRRVRLPSTVGSIGVLEEYRIFVREEYEVPGVSTTRLTPVLSRAHFLPGTDQQVDRVDIADNVIDLQIAVGADADGSGVVEESADGAQDEILFNALTDTDADTSDDLPAGVDPPVFTWYDPDLEYHFLRINTLVQSRFPDTQHLAPGLGDIEDHNRGATVTLGATRYNDEIRYHRRWLQTVVELRNLL